ncbi:hypothetical protein HLI_20795 [Halobacillus litoralis]|uniref:Uncharacterized protein n=1 Tax=Halobacillus litoralis TaxID=45668 RepID=A0A410MIF6_9BACI|nr:hypothetical protein HLI_20795 [Halobacillus litoralis]
MDKSLKVTAWILLSIALVLYLLPFFTQFVISLSAVWVFLTCSLMMNAWSEYRKTRKKPKIIFSIFFFGFLFFFAIFDLFFMR